MFIELINEKKKELQLKLNNYNNMLDKILVVKYFANKA